MLNLLSDFTVLERLQVYLPVTDVSIFLSLFNGVFPDLMFCG